jgi:long-chain acyl-CoA synthetase
MADSIPNRLFRQADVRPEAPAYHVRGAGGWTPTSWRAYGDEVRRCGRALLAVGFERGQVVAILGFNRPEWVVMDLACMAAGGAPAGIYTTSSAPEVGYILRHSEAPVVLVEDAGQLAKVLQVRAELPHLRHVVLMRGAGKPEGLAAAADFVLTWDEFLARAEGASPESLQARVDTIEPEQLACLIYTSGTTGPPKAVMLSHRNLTWTASAAVDVVGFAPADCSVSYLPLSHIAEQMFTIYGPVTAGAQVYFAESIEKVADNLKEVQPTVVFGVPRIWEKFYEGVTKKLAEAKGFKKTIADWAGGVGRAYHAARNEGRSPGLLLELQYKLAHRLVFSKVRPALGLGRARMCITGAAPISARILEFFTGLDVVIREVYGQSEDCGPTSFNRIGRTRFGTVGPAFPGVEVTIADDGEILVRGPNVFQGYYKDPAATAEALQDGYLHSGDLGAFDDAGFLRITGRKKEIIITAGGKNITPRNIEELIERSPLVADAVVIGDQRKFLSALITLEPEAAAALCREHGGDASAAHLDARVRAEVQRAVDAANAELARVENIRKFTILARGFSVDDGELTPTLKLKRKVVAKHFEPEIEAMYREAGAGAAASE